MNFKSTITIIFITLILATISYAGTYSDNIDGIGWFNGTNLNVSDIRQDLNFNNKNISQIELVNGVNFTSAIISDYDYIIYQKPGSVYDCGSAVATCIISKNGSTQRIQNASSSFSTVLINTTSNMLKGKIYIKSGTYIPTQEINYTDGISIVADAVTLTVTGYNGTVFNITGIQNTEKSNNQTEISGFRLLGSLTNTGFLFVKVTSVPRGIIIRDIFHGRVSNLIELTGSTFSADISNINGYYLNGTWMNFTSTPSASVTNVKVHNSEVSNAGLDNLYNSSIGIKIDQASAVIDDVWIETFKTAIMDNGSGTVITNSYLVGQSGTGNDGVSINVTAPDNRGRISGNTIFTGEVGSKGIWFTQPASDIGTVTNNIFRFSAINTYPDLFSYGILGENVSGTITGNQFWGDSYVRQNTAIQITNNTNLTLIVNGNSFIGMNETINGTAVGVGNTYFENKFTPPFEMLNNNLSLNNKSLFHVNNLDDPINTAVNNSGLVFKMISDENYTNYTSTMLYDTSGYGNNCKWSGSVAPNFSTWKAGTPIKLDGTDDFLSCGNDTSLHITGAITIGGWIKINDLTTTSALFGRGRAIGAEANNGYFMSYYAPANAIYFDTYNLTTRNTILVNNIVTDNNWHHVLATWDGSMNSNSKKLYFDGALAKEGDPEVSFIGVPSTVFKIGQDSLNNYEANAEFYDVRVYNRYMDADEVNRLYHSNPQDEKSSVIRGNITTFVNNSGHEKFSINQTGVFSNFTMPVCSNSVVNQTGSMCLNMTSEPTPNFPQVNIWNGTRWTFMNGTGV